MVYILVCSSDKYWCVPVAYILPCASIVCVCLGDFRLPLALFQVDYRVLASKFSPPHVNQGGAQKTTPQVTLYKPHTAKESLRKRRVDRHVQVLPGNAGQAWELSLMLLPPHERVCVIGHLLHSHVGI